MSQTLFSNHENFKKMENHILNEVMNTSKSLLKSFEFNIIYSSKVSEKQEKETATKLKKYRDENWTKALKTAKGDKNKAHAIYTANLKDLF